MELPVGADLKLTLGQYSTGANTHDGKKTLAMLRCKAGESINSILDRLNAAIAVAKATGQCVDDLNRPNSDVTYKY